MARRTVGSILALLAFAWLTAAGHAQTTWQTKPFVDRTPPPSQYQPPRAGSTERLLQQIAREAGIPFGFEWTREPLPDSVAEPSSNTLSQMTVEQALDAVVQADPRYAWRELDGVLVIRPRAAWTDPHHPFNRPIGTLDVRGTNPLAVLIQVRAWMYPDASVRPAWQMPLAPATFDLHVKDATVLQVLDATVKTAGDVYWCLSYAESPICGNPPPAGGPQGVWLFMHSLSFPHRSEGGVYHRGPLPRWTGSSR